jgi:biotin-(acetyl-CoA carboxylase) ligase
VAVSLEDLPADLRRTTATLNRPAGAIEQTLAQLLTALERRLADPATKILDAWRERDVLQGHDISWKEHGRQLGGRAEGIDSSGRLLVVLPEGRRVALEAGEVHVGTASKDPA